ISHLRKTLGATRIVTKRPGYLIQIGRGELDVHEFERLLELGRAQLAAGEADSASASLAEALALWRGPPLAEFADQPLAQRAIVRLDELRLVAIETSIDAELTRGQARAVIGRLEELVAEHPLRERLREQLLLALYRAGRQADALAAYRDARRVLVEELGLEPGAALRDLEGAILRQDPALAAAPRPDPVSPGSAGSRRAIVVTSDSRDGLDALLSFAEPMTRAPARELILARLCAGSGDLATATHELDVRRQQLAARDVEARVTAFTSKDVAADVLRLAMRQDVDLVVLDGSAGLEKSGRLRGDVAEIVVRAPCDVALVMRRVGPLDLGEGRGVYVPFGGDEHEWAAVELGAWVARSRNAPLCLVGSESGDGLEAQRDASRLLSSAGLAVQGVTDVVARPLLVAPGAGGVIDATIGGGLIVLGLPDDWRRRGVGSIRAAVARGAEPPVVFVRNGVRPGALAPAESLTRFGWTLSGSRA
ncbi:MAG: BTAD domain-containing putative transcriptional regulator, partial [Gaiellales bacterium]